MDNLITDKKMINYIKGACVSLVVVSLAFSPLLNINLKTAFADDEEVVSDTAVAEIAQLPICNPNIELVRNGGFESPIVTNEAKWDIFGNSDSLGWNVAWLAGETVFEGQTRPEAHIELQRHYNGWLAAEGEQFAELDSDWGGPNNEGVNEPAAIKISQALETVPGTSYKVTFSYASRPDSTEADNGISFWFDGSDMSGFGIKAPVAPDVQWHEYSYNVIASGNNSEIAFQYEGLANSMGGFLDNVSVKCIGGDDNQGGGHEEPANHAPVLTLLGDNPISILVGDNFVDPGATALDTEDGDLTDSIVVTGSVNASTTGTYTLTYSVTDSEGASTAVFRNVIVEDRPVCTRGTDGVLSYEQFIAARNDGLIDYSVNANQDTLVSEARINNRTNCIFPVSMTSYKVFDQVLSHQQFFSGTEVVNATSTTYLKVNLPNCMAQSDLWLGLGPRQLRDHGPLDNQDVPVFNGPDLPVFLAGDFTFNGDRTWYNAEGPFCSHDTNATNTPPTITLLGNNPLYVATGTLFIDPGATALDTEDGDLTDSIVVTGSVNASTTGTYIINYSVTDSGGLSTSTSRTVVISASTTATTTPPGDNGGGGGGNGGGGGGGGSLGGHRHDISTVSSGGEVLGASSCFYLRDFLRKDWNNDPIEVLKLQSFLNVFEKENLSLTSVFDDSTFHAVERFQNKYFGDILQPWGHTAPTGFVYILTKKKVNEIYCNSLFPVTPQQQQEINAFRAFLESLRARGIPVDDFIVPGETIGSTNNLGNFGLATGSPIVVLNATSTTESSILKNVAVTLLSFPKDTIVLIGLAIIAIILIALSGIRDTKRTEKVIPLSSSKQVYKVNNDLLGVSEDKPTSTTIKDNIILPGEEIIIEGEDEESSQV